MFKNCTVYDYTPYLPRCKIKAPLYPPYRVEVEVEAKVEVEVEAKVEAKAEGGLVLPSLYRAGIIIE